MHKNANENRRSHAKNRTARHNHPPLPRNKRELPERHLVLGIEKAAAFGEPVSVAASLSFILFSQLDSSSPVFGWYFM
jgi:hypothetical protein